MRSDVDSLTPRERQVLRLVAAGLSDKLIANEIGIARSTVSNHVCVLLLKLHARNRAEAAARAVALGIVTVLPVNHPV